MRPALNLYSITCPRVIRHSAFKRVNAQLHSLRLLPVSRCFSTSTAPPPSRTLATMSDRPHQFMNTSGETDPVWVRHMPYAHYPHFPTLEENVETEVCIVGAGIAGISIAYELVTRGQRVTMLEARNVLSGETGRTSGHLANALDDGYTEIAKKHGRKGAQAAADSHTWAIHRVGEIARHLHLDCEYRTLPAYEISQYPRDGETAHSHAAEVRELQQEVEFAQGLGLAAQFHAGRAVRGWEGAVDQRDAAVFQGQATFHPTKYLVGVLEWLRQQPNFQCYTGTRMMSSEEEQDGVRVQTAGGHTVTAAALVQATCVPLQKLSVIAEMEYMRTYCIAIRIPKGSVEDCLLYDAAEAYKYVRFTACDETDDYLVIGGCDHKVGQERTAGRFDELEGWVRERFPQAGAVDYRWSGQIFEPVDYMAFIGKNQGLNHTYIVTGDSGNGLTHGVLAGKLIADEITGVENPWADLYNPNRMKSIAKSMPSMLKHDLQINAQYKRWMQSDITDIEDLAPCSGGVMKENPATPVAVYKDEHGKAHKFSAICPHMKAVLSWNETEKSWDCPVHGSRFSCDGVCIEGPAKANLTPMDEFAKQAQRAQETM
ncbi:FAD-dependent oxidoreductase [Aspergillus saccharolyticus JOP 1030-1]|uniref:Gamma-glutamylputrescine oxidoreductase n=1 Tax=Aspergillus saccharolyticus JOP 1030-1 TaxID=1450539 RepID=A0A318ZX46_9EURO|nr:gamma-glutamylputrescine oxidoreductase [Aspergillus saccharolyticus JOP 1030-1]PYH48660.1 gamma-glutamylputrescine oxidoreductase [Aspergillus saccharolyticus JOP 1030-1]